MTMLSAERSMNAGELGSVPLTSDRTIRLEAPGPLLDALSSWLPRRVVDDVASRWRPQAATKVAGVRGAACVRVTRDEPEAAPDGAPLFQVGRAAVWSGHHADRLRLFGEEGSSGRLHLGQLTAHIACPPGAANDLPDMLVTTIGLLAARQGSAMVHAASVIAPDDRLWILAGPSGSGKSTATANLVRAGWDYLADDRVFFRRNDRSPDTRVLVEGWLRPFMLTDPDIAGEGNSSSGLPGREARNPTDPGQLGSGRARGGGVLGGVLFPEVVSADRTCCARLSEPESLQRLLRESPWLMADPASAPDILGLLREAACVPAYVLRLAPDTQQDHRRLATVLGALDPFSMSIQ